MKLKEIGGKSPVVQWFEKHLGPLYHAHDAEMSGSELFEKFLEDADIEELRWNGTNELDADGKLSVDDVLELLSSKTFTYRIADLRGDAFQIDNLVRGELHVTIENKHRELHKFDDVFELQGWLLNLQNSDNWFTVGQ